MGQVFGCNPNSIGDCCNPSKLSIVSDVQHGHGEHPETRKGAQHFHHSELAELRSRMTHLRVEKASIEEQVCRNPPRCHLAYEIVYPMIDLIRMTMCLHAVFDSRHNANFQVPACESLVQIKKHGLLYSEGQSIKQDARLNAIEV